MQSNIPTDFQVQDHGSIVLLRPLTPLAESWLDAHVDEDAQHFGTALAVERRYIGAILEGIQADGMQIEF